MKNYADLIEKYYAGDTTLEEEKQLEQFFASEDSENKDELLIKQFQYFSNFRKMNYRKVSSFNRYIAAAILLISAFIGYEYAFNDSISIQSYTSVKTIVLPDSSIVHLNKGSVLTYSADFNKENRHIFLNGEAFFEITHNEKKPFIVQLKQTFVKVLGTKFNLREVANTTELLVTEGQVALSVSETPKRKILVKKGEEASYKNKVLKKEVGEINHNVTSWLTQDLVFKQTGLKKAFKQIEKHYNVTFDINNVDISGYRISGVYQKLPLKNLLETICELFELKYHYESNQYTLLKL